MPEPAMSRQDMVRTERQQRHRRGHRGEGLASLMLRMKGYRIIGRRVATPAGEIDIIATRRGRLAFVEVKLRASRAAAEACVSNNQRRRVHRAADLWLARHPVYGKMELGFDLVFVLPWRWPQHLPNAL